MSHTQGSWIADGDEILTLNGDVRIADVPLCDGMNPTEWQANLRLIAAAPDLLAALRRVLDMIAADDLIPESVSYMRFARAVIKKAEGAQ